MRRLFHFLGAAVLLCFIFIGYPHEGYAAPVQDIGAGTTPIDANGQASGCNFTADGTVTVANGNTVNSEGLNADAITNSVGTANNGTITFSGNSTVTGDIGQAVSGAVKQINLSPTAATRTVTVNKGAGTGNISAQGMTFTGNFGNSILALGDGVNLTVANNISTSNDTRGLLVFNGTSTVMAAEIGASGAALNRIRMDGTGVVSITANNIYVTNNMYFNNDGTFSLGDGTDLQDGVTTATDNTGTLILNGTSSVLNAVGANTPRWLKEVKGGSAGGVATFMKNVFATTATVMGTGTVNFQGNFKGTTLNFAADGKAEMDNGSDITANVTTATNNTGTLAFKGAGVSAVTGDVGADGAALKLIEIGTVNPGSTVNFSGDVFAQSLNFAQDGTVTIADDKGLTAAVTTSTTDEGTLTFNGTSTMSGQVGTSSSVLKLIKAGAAGETATFQNDVYATQLNVTNNGTVQLNGNYTGILHFNAAAATGTINIADGKNIIGKVTTATNHQGTLEFQGATTTGGAIGAAGKRLAAVNFNGATGLGHNIWADTATIKSGGNVTLNNDVTITGNLINSGASSVLDIGTNTLTVTKSTGAGGVYTQNAGSTLALSASGSTAGSIVADANAVVNAGSSVNVNVAGYIPSATAFTIIDSAGSGSPFAVPGTITSSSPMYTFAGSAVGGDLTITATRANTFSSVSTGNGAAAGAVLESVASAGASGDMLNLINALDSLPSTGAVNKALQTLVPIVDGGVPMTSVLALKQFIDTTLTRLQNVIMPALGTTGVATGGDYLKGLDIWAQGFGDYSHQDPRQASNGYNATVWGTALGVDRPVHGDNVRLGISSGYAQSFVRSKDNSGRTDIDSYQGTLYGGYRDEQRPYYVNCAFTFAYNTYDSSRHIAVGAIDRIAASDYNGQQYSALVDFGYGFKCRNLKITPTASAQYMYLHIGDYTERDAGAAGLMVDSQNYQMFQTGFGAKAEYPIKTKYGTVVPEVYAKWLYDFIGDTQATTSVFSGGGGSFATTGFTPAQSTWNFGGKLTLLTKSNFTVEMNYDFQVKEDYWEHAGWLELIYKI